MPPLPVVSSDDAVRVFERVGFRYHRQQGSHVSVRHSDGRHLSIPGGRQELKRGTLRTLVRQAGLTVEEFVALLE